MIVLEKSQKVINETKNEVEKKKHNGEREHNDTEEKRRSQRETDTRGGVDFPAKREQRDWDSARAF
ncbi:hypothetical protein YC2023_065388 [Brassica napus]